MEEFVSDTMALILYLENRKVPYKAKSIFKQADVDEVHIHIPSMVLAEIGSWQLAVSCWPNRQKPKAKSQSPNTKRQKPIKPSHRPETKNERL